MHFRSSSQSGGENEKVSRFLTFVKTSIPPETAAHKKASNRLVIKCKAVLIARLRCLWLSVFLRPSRNVAKSVRYLTFLCRRRRPRVLVKTFSLKKKKKEFCRAINVCALLFKLTPFLRIRRKLVLRASYP